jgi:hypothetical protein
MLSPASHRIRRSSISPQIAFIARHRVLAGARLLPAMIWSDKGREGGVQSQFQADCLRSTTERALF